MSTSRWTTVVELGQRLGVIEAMKMEMAVTAPMRGRVRDVFVSRNVQVLAGAPLFRLEPDGGDGDGTPARAVRIDLDAFAGAATATASSGRIVLAFVLGFDVDPAERAPRSTDGAHRPRRGCGDPPTRSPTSVRSRRAPGSGQDVEQGTVTS